MGKTTEKPLTELRMNAPVESASQSAKVWKVGGKIMMLKLPNNTALGKVDYFPFAPKEETPLAETSSSKPREINRTGLPQFLTNHYLRTAPYPPRLFTGRMWAVPGAELVAYLNNLEGIHKKKNYPSALVMLPEPRSAVSITQTLSQAMPKITHPDPPSRQNGHLPTN